MDNAQKPKAFLVTDTSVTLFFQGHGIRTFSRTSADVEKLIDELHAENWDEVITLCDRLATARKHFAEHDDLIITEDEITYRGTAVTGVLVNRILALVREQKPAQSMINFLNNLMENPSARSVDQLYRFMECNNLPITEDGYLLAYKSVGQNYLDMHSRSISNKVGEVVSMRRNAVNDNPEQTCSSGLHFCSIEYLRGWSGTHLMVLKINPADVVSIPIDYENSKGRCCKYEVIDELPMDSIKGGDRCVLSEHGSVYEYDEDEDEDYFNDYSYNEEYD